VAVCRPVRVYRWEIMTSFCVCECFPPCPALPLTFDNVYEVVKTVRSWRELAKGLLRWYDSNSDGQRKLDAIEHQHVSDEARRKAVVEVFLKGEGPFQPSWRMLIHRLHWAWQSHVAEKIKTNAEPHQGEWVSVWRGRWLSSHIMCAPYLIEVRLLRACESMYM
jgi:hypothetical protein